MLGGVFAIPMMIEGEEALLKRFHPAIKWGMTVLISGAVLQAVIPSERGLMMMVGGYFVTNIDGIEKLPPNVVGAASEFLERYIDEEETPERAGTD